MDDASALLVTVTGRDRPGITSGLCQALEHVGARVLDMEQVVVTGRLLLGLHVSPGAELDETHRVLAACAGELGVDVEVRPVAGRRGGHERARWYVVVLGQPLRAGALAAVTTVIAECGANIDRIHRLSRYPITSFELLVSGGDAPALRDGLARAAAAERIDVAVQRATLYRRAKRLIVMDVDSTLIQGEVIEMLAERAGHADAVRAVTERAMAGELDFTESLRERVSLLAGLPVGVVDEVVASVRLTPGARTLVRTLRRLGFTTAAVSGGFTQVIDHLRAELGVDHGAANRLQVRDGRLTGQVEGEVVDRAAKARLLRRFADAEGVPTAQVVAVGDGANDLDMLAAAGLGIAFNAKPVVREAADTAVSVPYLDAILFLLGITREEVEAADAEDLGVGHLE